MAEDAKPSLLEIARSKSKPRGPECGVAVALKNHPAQAPDIHELISATPVAVQYSTAAETFREAGISLSADTISRHRRNRCSCVAS